MSKYNFTSIYKEYLNFIYPRHKKQGYETMARNFKLHIFPYFKNFDISKINEQNIIKWQNEILKKNFSNSFNNSLYYLLSDFINYCVMNKYIDYNIFDRIPKFPRKTELKKHNVYNLFQFLWFRLHLNNYAIKQYFNFMFFYGTRPSEAMALKFSDLRLFNLNINHSIHRRGKRELDTPKNQSSVRSFKISLLCKFRFCKLKKYYTKKYGSDIDFFIFGGIKPLSSTTIDRYKSKACKKAKLFEITQHEFRHSYATRMIHKGVPIDSVSRVLGHSRISTTCDNYLHQEKRVFSTLFSRFNF